MAAAGLPLLNFLVLNCVPKISTLFSPYPQADVPVRKGGIMTDFEHLGPDEGGNVLPDEGDQTTNVPAQEASELNESEGSAAEDIEAAAEPQAGEPQAAEPAPSDAPEEQAISSENNAEEHAEASHAQNIPEGKLPRRGKAFAGDGRRMGKVKKSVWYDEAGNRLGEFVKEGRHVLFRDGERKLGYVDADHNVFTNEHEHLAIIRPFERMWFLMLLAFLLLVTIITGVVSSFFVLRSNADDIPVFRITDTEGTDWEFIENLPIFENDYFDVDAIVPGMSGSYRFILENLNDYSLDYDLVCTEENDFGIDIRFRLLRDGHYLTAEEGYDDIENMDYDLTIMGGSSQYFVLEWYWADDDPVDTNAGENGAEYTFTLTINAAKQDAEETA